MELKRIGALSCGKVMGIVYAGLGLIIGFFVAVSSMFGLALGSLSSQGRAEGVIAALFGVGAFFFFPILYGIMGFLGGALTALIYNAAARVIGGIELEFDQLRPSGVVGRPD